MIILLNGATSSGKTMLAKSIQYLDDRPWLLLGIDTMINMMPSKYWVSGDKQHEGFYFTEIKSNDSNIMRLFVARN